MSTLSDEDLISGFYDGRPAFFDELFVRYKGKIFNFSLRMLDNRADAEDVTADVFLKVYEDKHAYQPRAKFSTWLFAVTRNACLSRIRQRKPVFSLWFSDGEDEKAHDVADERDNPRDDMHRKNLQHHVQVALKKLPAEQKEAIILREFQQFSYQEIAEITGMSLENVKVTIYRARTAIGALLPSGFKEDFYG